MSNADPDVGEKFIAEWMRVLRSECAVNLILLEYITVEIQCPGTIPLPQPTAKTSFFPPWLLSVSTDLDTKNSWGFRVIWWKNVNRLIKIEECAAKRQANIDSGKEVIVGVNKYKLDTEDKIDVLVIDNMEVKTTQLARLDQVRNLIS